MIGTKSAADVELNIRMYGPMIIDAKGGEFDGVKETDSNSYDQKSEASS